MRHRVVRQVATMGRVALVVATTLTLLAACEASPTSVDGETFDAVTPAFVMVESDGGNTAYGSLWRVDSATRLASYTSLPHCLPASGCPALHREHIADSVLVRLLFARTQATDFRALRARYPRFLPADIGGSTVTIVANGRRRTIEGALPEPAASFANGVAALTPVP